MNKQENSLEEVELRSEDFQYVFIKTPRWILRWGIYLILLIVILFIIGSVLFKYPDTISAPFTLTGTTPPARIKAKKSGLLTKLYVSGNQIVSKGDYLAIIENSAKEENMKYIKKFLVNFLSKDTIYIELPMKDMELGEVQTSYLSFYQTLYNYKQFRKNHYHEKKINILKDRISFNTDYYNGLLKQQSVRKKQLYLKEKQYKRDSILYLRGVISEQDLEETNVNYLNARLNLLTTNTNIDDIRISMTEMTGTFIETENDFIDKENYYIVEIRNQALQLLTEIQSWEINYVLQSPIDGKISFNSYWSEHQNIIAEEDVFNIIPANNSTLIAKVFLPMTRSGKVKVNQKVNLHFDNFPDNEFGVVRGMVKNISLLPSVSGNISFYVAEITLPTGLETSYKKKLPYYPEMKGKAEVVTEDLSLFQRIMYPIRKILVENIIP